MSSLPAWNKTAAKKTEATFWWLYVEVEILVEPRGIEPLTS
jgi:hypothetical protein